MKSLVSCIILITILQQHITDASASMKAKGIDNPSSGNLFIITIDGFRWQEIFNGADPDLINNEKYTPDTATMKMLYGGQDAEGRRKKLLPFFWNIINTKGQLYGNREYDNKVNTANLYSVSYPGYNEIFTGNTDISISSNNKYINPNTNILEYLGLKEQFRGKVAAFTSWDVFPYILNGENSVIEINSGYEMIDDPDPTQAQQLINKVQSGGIYDKTPTRHDELTFLTAKEYITRHHPRVVYLGLGETDEAAHDGRYDLYLEKANEADRMIAKLWHFVQTTPGYKDNTIFLITTDHGRGRKNSNWTQHGAFIKGSSQTWMAVIGPGITSLGEVKQDQQIYQEQMAQTIASLLGEKFETDQPVASAVLLK